MFLGAASERQDQDAKFVQGTRFVAVPFCRLPVAQNPLDQTEVRLLEFLNPGHDTENICRKGLDERRV